jgi:hypothetical protein
VNFDQAVYAAMHGYSGLGSIPIRPDVAAQGDVAPYIVYALVYNAPNWTLTGASTLDNARYQIDVYSNVRATAQSLADLVTAAITQSPVLTGVPLNATSGYEPETKLFRRTLEFSVWLNA